MNHRKKDNQDKTSPKTPKTKSTPDIDDFPSPENTPKLVSRRLTIEEFEREGHDYTISELSKLLEYQWSRYNYLKLWLWRCLSLGILIAALYFSLSLPYCGSWLAIGPCRVCPENAECGAFWIKGCKDGFTLQSGWICTIADPDGEVAYELSLRAQKYLDEIAWNYDCVGIGSHKDVSIYDLRDHLFNTSEQLIKQSASIETVFTELQRLLENHQNLYKISVVEDSLSSFRFSEILSCWTGLQYSFPVIKNAVVNGTANVFNGILSLPQMIKMPSLPSFSSTPAANATTEEDVTIEQTNTTDASNATDTSINATNSTQEEAKEEETKSGWWW